MLAPFFVRYALLLLTVFLVGCASGVDDVDYWADVEEFNESGFEEVQWLADIDTNGLTLALFDQVNECMIGEGFSGAIPPDQITSYVSLDFDAFMSVPVERHVPSEDGYVQPEEEVNSASGLTGQNFEQARDPAFLVALLGFDPDSQSLDPDVDPLADPDGCLWESLARVLRTELGFETSQDLLVMEELHQLRVALWMDFDAVWSECMAREGFSYRSLSDPYFEYSNVDASSEELEVARSDIRCRRETLSNSSYQEAEARANSEASEVAEGVR